MARRSPLTPTAAPEVLAEAGRASRWALPLAALVSVALALVVSARSLGAGIYLYRDFVTVPHPVLGPQALGTDGQPPRAVPLDAVMALLAPVLASGIQQQLMLVGSMVLAGTGVAVLLRHHGVAAMVAGAAVATWNPFVAERLMLGQPPTLLAYSMTPWLVAAVRSRWRTSRGMGAVLVAALPAALTPWGGVTALLTVVVVSLATPWRRSRVWLGGCLVLSVAWCLPWLVPALVHGGRPADPDGANAFASRADGPLGTAGSLLTLGGVWARGARPASRSSVAATIASVMLAVLAVAVLVHLLRERRPLARLLAAALLGPAIAAWAVSLGPGLRLFRGLQQVPGVAIARDTHRWVGLTAVATAVLVGWGVGALGRRLVAPGTRAPVLAALTVAVIAGSVLTVPDLPAVVDTAYEPVRMPADWAPMVDAVEHAAGPGSVLVTPWAAFRQIQPTPGAPTWNGRRAFLDPLPRALTRTVVGSHELAVGVGDDEVFRVDDDRSAVDDYTTAGRLDADKLRAHGVAVVVQWRDTVGTPVEAGLGLRRIFEGPHFDVWAVTR